MLLFNPKDRFTDMVLISVGMRQCVGSACIQQILTIPGPRTVDGRGPAAAALPDEAAGELHRVEAIQAHVGKGVDPMILVIPVGSARMILVEGISR